MAWPKGFAGTVNTDIDSAGIGAVKVTGASGAYRLSGWNRAFRAIASQTTFYQFSDTLTDKNYRVPLTVFVDSTTLIERTGINLRDTSTNATTGRNMVHYRLRTEASTSAFLEIYGVVGGSFPGSANASVGFTIASNTLYTFICEALDDVFTIYAADGETVLCGPVTISDAVLQNIGKVSLYSSGTSTAATAGATDGNGTGTHIVSVDFEYLSADVEATGAPASVTVTAPTGVASAPGSASGDPAAVSVTAPTGVASSGLALALQEHHGSNVHLANSTVTNGETATPTVDVAIRNPEGGAALWQHFRFALHNPDGSSKTATITIDLTNQEGGNTIRSTWSGPYRATTLDDITAWSALSRTAPGGILTFDVVVGAGETVYVCSMPPGIRPQVEDWLATLEATYPSLIHDDVASRVAFAGAPYQCDTAPTVLDELGRTLSDEPMMAFRVGNDAVGVPALKPEICLFSMLHPGEDHGFIQLRGFLDKWLSDAAFATVRGKYNLVVRPIGAPNGCTGGYRRYEPRSGLPSGDNLNREWKPSTLNVTAQKWQTLLNTDHGVTFSRVRALIDFHDLAHSSQVVTAYYRAETPNGAALQAIIAAEFAGAQILESVSDSTTTDYFVNTKGPANGGSFVGPAKTAEVSDQSTGLTGFLAVGAGWANIVKAWDEAGLMGADAIAAPASVTVTAPTGFASAPGDDVEASGAPAGIAVTAPEGIATATAFASGAPAGITVTAPTGSAFAPGADVEASGAPAAITVTSPTGVASGDAETMPPIDMRFILSLKSELTTFRA